MVQMKKNKITLEVKKEDQFYTFLCNNDAPLGEVFDVLCAMKGYVLDFIIELEKQEKERNGIQTDSV